MSLIFGTQNNGVSKFQTSHNRAPEPTCVIARNQNKSQEAEHYCDCKPVELGDYINNNC